jgi:hypothetical protein
MTALVFDTSDLDRKLRNVNAYTNGFVAGIHQGKYQLLNKIGASVVEVLSNFIDTMAAGNPAALHHIYEWGSVGGARLFEFNYTVGGSTVAFSGHTTQSGSIAPTADRPFYNKADVMESGQGVTISPSGSVLAFDVDGRTVFTPHAIHVSNPGGSAVAGSFQRTTDMFFNQYFTQAFLHSSGLLKALSTPTAYAAMFAAGANGGGYGTGVTAGQRYISGAGALI